MLAKREVTPEVRSSVRRTTFPTIGWIRGYDFRGASGTHAPPFASTDAMLPNTSSGSAVCDDAADMRVGLRLAEYDNRSTRSSHTSIWCSTTTKVSRSVPATWRTASCTSLTPSDRGWPSVRRAAAAVRDAWRARRPRPDAGAGRRTVCVWSGQVSCSRVQQCRARNGPCSKSHLSAD